MGLSIIPPMITTITNAVLTAYCACTVCCGKNAKNICADGKKPVQGITVAASRSIPLGSKAIINGKTYIVQDRLAKRFDDRFDIFFQSHKEARIFGKKTGATVKIVTN